MYVSGRRIPSGRIDYDFEELRTSKAIVWTIEGCVIDYPTDSEPQNIEFRPIVRDIGKMYVGKTGYNDFWNMECGPGEYTGCYGSRSDSTRLTDTSRTDISSTAYSVIIARRCITSRTKVSNDSPTTTTSVDYRCGFCRNCKGSAQSCDCYCRRRGSEIGTCRGNFYGKGIPVIYGSSGSCI